MVGALAPPSPSAGSLRNRGDEPDAEGEAGKGQEGQHQAEARIATALA